MVSSRSAAMRCFNRFYRRIQQKACVYCGLRATAYDHFVPISVVHMLACVEGEVTGKFLLPSCGECNAIAGARIFKTVASKRRHIQERLKKKYKKILAMPDWQRDETETFGWSMESYILAGMAQKNVLEQRLAWRNTNNE